jgi:hypothetical protein
MRKEEKAVSYSHGRQVAGHSKLKAKKPRNRLVPDPSLRVQLRYDPVEPLTEEEFPARFR